jgi:hypothetical protein
MEKKRMLELIWTDFVQVYTNINYSSLYSETLRENQKDIYYWAIYACFGLPPILSLVVKRYAISNDWLFFGVIALILLLPLAVRIKNKQLIYTVFGIHEKEIGGLLKLNEDLDRYKDALLAFYFRVEAMSEKSTRLREMQLEYEKLKNENARYLTEHDKLTGKIDPVIQKTAQEKTFEMIKNTNYYGRGITSQG